MPDRVPPTDPSDLDARPRRRTARPRATEAEALAIVERAAAIADGLALLERAPLECVAVLLGVEPRVVERVRAALEDPAFREEAALRFARAAGRRPPTAPASAPAAPSPRDPAALVAAARRREGGLAILRDASAECAAIVFGVHPDLVHRARELLARGGAGEGAPAT